MRRLIYVLLALSVVLVGLSFAQNSEEGGESPSEGTWTVDLTEAGFGVVMFEPAADPNRWGGRFVQTQAVDSDGVCHVYYDPQADPNASFADQPEMANAPGFDTGGYITFFQIALFACANGGEAPEVVGDPDGLYVLDWIDAFFASCEDDSLDAASHEFESYYRLGWRGEPQTSTDLSCVPHFNEFMSNYEVET